jgi:hypothetical protein
MYVMCSVLLSNAGRDQSPLHGVLPKHLNRFIVSEVNSESEQARGPNP